MLEWIRSPDLPIQAGDCEVALSTQTLTGLSLPLYSKESTTETPGIATVGGKGANLARLARAGLAVPDGFLLTTEAYRVFVAANNLEPQILKAITEAPGDDLETLEGAAGQIQAWFANGRMPAELRQVILGEYQKLGEPAAAVRSSATTEDLPELSFAGQQDTFLNVLGGENLLTAVVNCWSSLWTARAIGYRARNGVPQAGIALAVVVQKMVESQTSGVAFTANPLSGLRSEVVIDATLGLGEALVSGQVEPDHYVVDTISRRIRSKTLGAKALAIRGQAGGGTTTIHEDHAQQQALPDEQILALAGLCQQVAGLYETPQDIEWAWAENQLYLLQARPITSLFPTPEGVPAEPLEVFFSVAAIQGMLDPITPIGRYAMKVIFATGAGLFKVKVTPETQAALYTAGERLWLNATALLRNAVGRRIFYAGLNIIEPTIRQAVGQVLDEPQLQPERAGVRFKTLGRLANFLFPAGRNIISNLMHPEARRITILAKGDAVLAEMRQQIAAMRGDRYERLSQQAELLPRIGRSHLLITLILYFSGVAAGMVAFNFLRMLIEKLPAEAEGLDGRSKEDLLLEVTRSLPHNPTTRMDLDLWAAAQTIGRQASSRREFETHPATELARRYASGELEAGTRQLVQQFLERYGARGLAEIDLGRPRWQEDPTYVFETLASYLKIDRPEMAPDVVFAGGAATAEAAARQLAAALKKTRSGWLKARLAAFWVKRVRAWMGMREAPKFFAVQMMGLLREALLETGRAFAEAGELNQADDLMYLTFPELEALAKKEARDWQTLIASRRAAYRHELRRRQIPRLLLSDGRAYYEGLRTPATEGSGLAGSPVSPGSVEGRVRVVFDPRQANLQPGEILVCPGTDPSWTPLFLTAAGLVMEVGGMMTHGAVVAREYGIPAIVGVDQATRRLKTGQRIVMNGSTGQITLLETAAEKA